MYQEFYRGSALLDLPLFTLIFFVVFFAAMVTWVFFFTRKDERFDRMAQLPLHGERVGGTSDE